MDCGDRKCTEERTFQKKCDVYYGKDCHYPCSVHGCIHKIMEDTVISAKKIVGLTAKLEKFLFIFQLCSVYSCHDKKTHNGWAIAAVVSSVLSVLSTTIAAIIWRRKLMNFLVRAKELFDCKAY